MAKPPLANGIDVASLGGGPGGIPPWAIALIERLSTFMSQVSEALSGNLTTENGAEAFVDVEVTGGQTAKPFTYEFRGGRKVRGVFVGSAVGIAGDANPEAAVNIAWTATTVNGKPGVQLTGFSGVSTGKRARLTLLLKAE
jgi:hypothetical protein